MILQLNPTIPLKTPKGKGQALALIDYGSEHNLLWVTAIDDTGEIWTFPNPEVRAQKNITMGRLYNSKLTELAKSWNNVDRLDILCGNPTNPSIHPCDKCNSEKCVGKGKCKGFGAYSYCASLK